MVQIQLTRPLRYNMGRVHVQATNKYTYMLFCRSLPRKSLLYSKGTKLSEPMHYKHSVLVISLVYYSDEPNRTASSAVVFASFDQQGYTFTEGTSRKELSLAVNSVLSKSITFHLTPGIIEPDMYNVWR